MNKEDYLRTEIRDGYQVSVTRKKVWLCELEMATWFCNVCEKYGLSYFLIGGSAIGAVRHNGFIPWDDYVGDKPNRNISTTSNLPEK